MKIEPFRIAVDDEEIADLRRRLHATRWPANWSDPDWSYGVDIDFLKDLCAYWADGYDWRLHEANLNRFPQYLTEIDGAKLHFLHVRSPEPGATPLVMTHGWPGSIVEFTKVLGPLVDPVAHGGRAEDAFHVVCPSIPGYGFSGPTPGPGWNTHRIAGAIATLMAGLGYEKYGAQGGDWGATISSWLGHLVPEHLIGVHVNLVTVPGNPSAKFDDITPEEQAGLDRTARYVSEGSGYYVTQSTKPHSLGYGLEDSPAGLCAWIVEKFHDWGDHEGNVLDSFTRDEMLTDIAVYWFTRTATSAARLYYEAATSQTSIQTMPPFDVPTGCAVYPAEIVRPSLRWAKLQYDVVHYARLERGGHFAAYEAPDLFVDDVRTFFARLRQDSGRTS